jgi:F-type H+-transporting ATPase subunit delta
MSEYKVSHMYEVSLFESAMEKNSLDAVSKDVELIYSTLEKNEQLMHVLSNPIIKPNVKFNILDEIFKSRVTQETIDFFHFLVEKKRESLLDTILKLFLEIRDEKLGIVNVEVRTFIPFTNSQIELLKNKLENYLSKKVRFKFKIDESIIGGFVARIGDTLFDASIKHQLELLKKQFLKGDVSLN